MKKRTPAAGLEHLGVRSRLKKKPAKTLVESAFSHELRTKEVLHEGMGIADMAHTAMLIKTGIIPARQGAKLLKALLGLHRLNPDKLDFDPRLGDLYNNRDHYLSLKLGNLSGMLHTGRPRREATTVAFVIASRGRLSKLGKELADFCASLLKTAAGHRDTFMTDFTYLHHAQPTTLAHYLIGYVYPFLRDLKRLQQVYRDLNLSPAGSGSVNGSSLPLDREYLRKLLGCDDIITHTRDAMWRHDTPIEAMSSLVSLTTHMDRLAEDLQIWTTEEFGFFELSDGHSRTSVIMPQKKNPYALTFIRGVARNLLGKYVSTAAAGQTPSGQPDNRIFIYEELPAGLETCWSVTALFSDIMKKGKFNKKRLFSSTGTGFPIATDLVDFLTVRTGLDNRSAHRIIGRVAQKVHAAPQTDVNSGMVYQAAEELAIPLRDFPEKDFRKLFEIRNLIEQRRTAGGACRQSVNSMIGQCRSTLTSGRAFFRKRDHARFARTFLGKIEAMIRRSL